MSDTGPSGPLILKIKKLNVRRRNRIYQFAESSASLYGNCYNNNDCP